jgi:uncharacterized protein involved in outer membrane biogenesis
MKKKILIGLVAVVVVVGIVLAVVAANLDKIVNSRKGELLAQAKARTGRELSVGEVGVALWPEIGVRVHDVVVGDDPAFSSEPFLRARDVRINVALMPLFKKRVVFKRVVLNEPEIAVIKGEGKRFNYTSLIEAAAPAGDGSSPKPEAGAAAVLAFADIKDGTVRYLDRQSGLDRTVRDIDLSVEGVGGGKTFKARLDAAVFGDGQDVHAAATAGPVPASGAPEDLRAMPLSATLTLDAVEIADLLIGPKKAGAAPPPGGRVEARATLSGTVGAAAIEELVVSATMMGAKEPNVELTASAGPFNLLADSAAVFAAARCKGTLIAGPLPLSGVKLKSADPKAPAPVLGGDLEARASFEGEASALVFDGEIDATAASYSLPPGFEKKAGIPARATVKGTLHPRGSPGEGVDFSRIDIVLHALTAGGSGFLVPFKGREAMEFKLEGKTAIGPWKDLMPAMAPFAPTGDATVSVRVSGAPGPGTPPRIEGTARVKNFGARFPQLPQPLSDGTATVAFTAKSARVSDGRFKIGQSAFQIEAEAPSFKPMQATYTLTSSEVRRADVQIAAPGAKAPPRPEVFKDVVATGRMRETAPKVMENEIALSSQSGVAANIDYTDLTADVRATPDKVFIDRYAAKALGGALSGLGTFEPKLAKFDLSAKVEKVNLAEYFRYKAPALVDVLVGRIDADLTIGGQGKNWEEMQKTLAGSGGAVVLEGALLNMNLADRLFSSIQGIPMVPADLTQRMRAKNPKLLAENRTAFQNLSGKVTIADGRLRTPDLKLSTSDFTIAGDGWFSFAKEMNVSSTLTLSEKLSRDLVAEVPAAKFLLSPNGRLEVPLTLTGAIAKPTVGVDAAAMTARIQQSMLQGGQQQLEQGLKDQVKGLLDGLGKKKPPAKKP